MSTRNIEKNNFLDWFIGFSEGDGSFQVVRQNVINNTTRPVFIIDQKDRRILFKIKKNLKCGSVTGPYQNKSSKSSYYRFRIGDRKGIRTLINIFNGRLVLSKTKSRFQLFLKSYNNLAQVQKFNQSIRLKDTLCFPSFKNAWLSGFIDAEGSFSGYTKFKNNELKGVAIKISLVQKNEQPIFLKLQALLGGSLHFDGTISRLTIEGVKDRELLLNYLKTYPLQSVSKSVAFTRFKKLHVRLTDGQFKWRTASRRAKERIIRLVKNINIS